MAGLRKTTYDLISELNDKSDSPQFTGEDPDFVSLFNLIVLSATAAGLIWLPYDEDSDGSRIPTVVFKGQSSPFHAFVLFIMFGFTASLSAFLSHNRPKVARVFRSCSVIFLSCAAAVFLYAACASFSVDR